MSDYVLVKNDNNVDEHLVKNLLVDQEIEEKTIQENTLVQQLVQELQVHDVPLAPSFLTEKLEYMSFHDPWQKLKHEIFLRSEPLQFEKPIVTMSKISQIAENLNQSISSIARYNSRIKTIKQKDLLQNKNEKQSELIISHSLPRSFWFKILDPTLIELGKQVPSRNAFQQFKYYDKKPHIIRKQQANWFQVLNPRYLARQTYCELIKKNALRPRINSCEYEKMNSKVQTLQFRAKQIPGQKHQVLSRLNIEQMDADRRLPPSPPRASQNFTSSLKSINSKKVLRKRPDQQSKTNSTMREVDDINSPNMSLLKFQQRQDNLSVPQKFGLYGFGIQNISSRSQRFQLRKPTINSQNRQTLEDQSPKSTNTTSRQFFSRFTNKAYKIYNADPYQQIKTDSNLTFYKTSSQDRFQKQDQNNKERKKQEFDKIIANTLCNQRQFKAKKDQKPKNRQLSKKQKSKKQLEVVNSYFPEISKLQEFKRKMF